MLYKTIGGLSKDEEFAIRNLRKTGLSNIYTASYDVAQKLYSREEFLVINLCKRYGPTVKLSGYAASIFMYAMTEWSALADIKPILKEVFKKVSDALSIGQPVLVHCNEGEIRSPGFVSLYRIIIENVVPNSIPKRQRELQALSDIRALSLADLQKIRDEFKSR